MKRGIKPNGAHRVDVHVGARVKSRRLLLKISQETLANDLGITFQQVQKYESGDNRISASRLYEIAKCLKVDAGHFFAELESTAGSAAEDPMNDEIAVMVVTKFNKLSENQRNVVLDVLDAMRGA